jgi:hypothetical protein
MTVEKVAERIIFGESLTDSSLTATRWNWARDPEGRGWLDEDGALVRYGKTSVLHESRSGTGVYLTDRADLSINYDLLQAGLLSGKFVRLTPPHFKRAKDQAAA